MPASLCYVNQRSYGLEKAPRWKQWFFDHVWQGFFRFCYFKLKIPCPDGIDQNGEVFFLQHERIVAEDWEAEQEAAKFPIGGWHRLPVVSSSPEGIECICHMPNSPRADDYARNGNRSSEHRVALGRLVEVLAESEGTVRLYKR